MFDNVANEAAVRARQRCLPDTDMSAQFFLELLCFAYLGVELLVFPRVTRN